MDIKIPEKRPGQAAPSKPQPVVEEQPPPKPEPLTTRGHRHKRRSNSGPGRNRFVHLIIVALVLWIGWTLVNQPDEPSTTPSIAKRNSDVKQNTTPVQTLNSSLSTLDTVPNTPVSPLSEIAEPIPEPSAANENILSPAPEVTAEEMPDTTESNSLPAAPENVTDNIDIPDLSELNELTTKAESKPHSRPEPRESETKAQVMAPVKESSAITLTPACQPESLRETQVELFMIPAGRYDLSGLDSASDPALFLQAHRLNYIDIDTPFVIQKDEVSSKQFKKYVDHVQSLPDSPDKNDLLMRIGLHWNRNDANSKSVRGISWEAASDYATWLSELTGCAFALPSRLQWGATVIYSQGVAEDERPEKLLRGVPEWSSSPCDNGYYLIGEDDWVAVSVTSRETCMPAMISVAGFRLVHEVGTTQP
ncbi:MAG: SUMF1/EgtB/PvdO family nonheme iron enzyme [Magnetococcales bacterium]|nr:SUMF1/EgtB/PvdO family nonheme iron enzyme [Magnetococcales bacterium]